MSHLTSPGNYSLLWLSFLWTPACWYPQTTCQILYSQPWFNFSWGMLILWLQTPELAPQKLPLESYQRRDRGQGQLIYFYMSQLCACVCVLCVKFSNSNVTQQLLKLSWHGALHNPFNYIYMNLMVPTFLFRYLFPASILPWLYTYKIIPPLYLTTLTGQSFEKRKFSKETQ